MYCYLVTQNSHSVAEAFRVHFSMQLTERYFSIVSGTFLYIKVMVKPLVQKINARFVADRIGVTVHHGKRFSVTTGNHFRVTENTLLMGANTLYL